MRSFWITRGISQEIVHKKQLSLSQKAIKIPQRHILQPADHSDHAPATSATLNMDVIVLIGPRYESDARVLMILLDCFCYFRTFPVFEYG